MKYIIDLILLWKSVPVLLNFFDIRRVWTDIDANGIPAGSPGFDGTVNGSVRTFATKEEAAVAGLAAVYAVYNLLNGGR